jgi:hypothetical protein
VEAGNFSEELPCDEYEDAAGRETEFRRGELMGWHCRLDTLYPDYGEGMVNRVVTWTRLTLPDVEVAHGGSNGV